MPSSEQATALPLAMLRPGESARVSHLASRSQGDCRKLTAMGFAAGVEIAVLNRRSGPLLVRIGDSRIALGRAMAQRVMVVLDG